MSGGFLHKLKGDLFLGYRAILAHPWRKLRDDDLRTGEERFLANYATEGLLPTTEADREVLKGAARCIHCGLCDAYDASLSVLPRTVHLGASQLPVSYTRAVPDIRYTEGILAKLDEGLLVRAEAVCPTRVPLRALVAYLRRKLEELKAHSPDQAP